MRTRIFQKYIRQVIEWCLIGRRTLNNLRILRLPSYCGVLRSYRRTLMGNRKYGGLLKRMTTNSWRPKKNG